MGGHQVMGHGSGDDGYDEEGYDESQRAEILEATRSGPSDGTVIVDLNPDIGEDDVEDEDELTMADGETGTLDDDGTQDEDDMAEDEVQADLDDDTLAEDGDLSDRDRKAIEP